MDENVKKLLWAKYIAGLFGATKTNQNLSLKHNHVMN